MLKIVNSLYFFFGNILTTYLHQRKYLHTSIMVFFLLYTKFQYDPACRVEIKPELGLYGISFFQCTFKFVPRRPT